MWMWFARLLCICEAAGLFFSLSLSPEEREASLALEGETEMNREGPLVEAEPGAVRSRPTP